MTPEEAAILTEITPIIQEAIYRLKDRRTRIDAILVMSANVFLEYSIAKEHHDVIDCAMTDKIANAMLNGAVYCLDDMAGITRNPDGTGHFEEEA
jgi:hypothetical protein